MCSYGYKNQYWYHDSKFHIDISVYQCISPIPNLHIRSGYVSLLIMLYILCITCNIDSVTGTGPFLSSLSRRSIQEAFWNDELHLELIQSGLNFQFYKPGDREECMILIENARRNSTYKHKCHEACQKRGMYHGHLL